MVDQHRILERTVAALTADPEVAGLHLSGSLAHGTPDGWSDLDLYIVAEHDVDRMIARQHTLRAGVAEILTAFPATRLGHGDSRQLIVFCRGTEDPIHVDDQYRDLRDPRPRARVANVRILLGRAGDLAR